jgi:hypothetical protein
MATIDEPEQQYREFTKGILDWRVLEQQEEAKRQKMLEEYLTNLTNVSACKGRPNILPIWAKYFLERLYWIFEDRRDNRPTETLLLTYA